MLRAILRRPVVALRHLRVGRDDLILAEYPKSGGTWLAFMMGQIAFGQSVSFENQERFVPGVGCHDAVTARLPTGGRLLRTHETYRRVYGKSVYLVRHVGDVAVSYYHWLRWLNGPTMEFKRFLPLFLKGKLDGYGPWARHVRSWMAADAVLVVRYEDLRADTVGAVNQIARFMDLNPSEEQILRAIQDNTLERMREKQEAARAVVFGQRNPNAHFVRRGTVGESASWLDEEDVALIREAAGPVLESLGYGLLP